MKGLTTMGGLQGRLPGGSVSELSLKEGGSVSVEEEDDVGPGDRAWAEAPSGPSGLERVGVVYPTGWRRAPARLGPDPLLHWREPLAPSGFFPHCLLSDPEGLSSDSDPALMSLLCDLGSIT